MKPYFIIVVLIALLNVTHLSAQNGMLLNPNFTQEEPEVVKLSALSETFIFSDVTTPLLGVTEKQDMYDYYRNDMEAVATNRLGEKSKLVKFEENYLKLEVSENHIVEVHNYLDNRKVEFADTAIVAPYYIDVVLSTVKVPAEDSEIAFYDAAHQQLATEKFFKVPAIEDFLNIKSKKEKKGIVSAYIEFPLIKYEFTPDGDLVATTTLANYMSEDKYEEIKDCIVPKLVYRWNPNKTKFELLKD